MEELITAQLGRETCWNCYRAQNLCLCSEIKPFETEPLIVLLIHPKEFRKTVGTARLVRLSILNSRSWIGHGADFDSNPGFQSLVSDPTLFPMVLYPGPSSLNLSVLGEGELKTHLPQNRRLAIFVIDGTWFCARKMIRTSKILSQLPQITFDFKTESAYGFRKQPKAFCLSTLEAVFELIENLNQKGLGKVFPESAHHQMKQGFQALVKSQVKYLGGDGWKTRRKNFKSHKIDHKIEKK